MASDIISSDALSRAVRPRASVRLGQLVRWASCAALAGVAVGGTGPAAALVARTGGTVTSGGDVGTSVVSFTVDERGQVADCRISGSSGHADLDARACGVSSAQFRPKPARSKGHMLADAPAILGSLDIVFGEVDR